MKIHAHFFSFIVALLFVFGCFGLIKSTFCTAAETESKEVLNDFRGKITEFLYSYSGSRKTELNKLVGGWVSAYYEISEDYNIDVQATSSLISPYTATCEFILIRHYTDFHETKNDAELDKNYIKTDSIAHKHYYAYQDGEWVVVNRTLNTYIPLTATDPVSFWSECSEHKGCWEKNIKANIVKKVNSK